MAELNEYVKRARERGTSLRQIVQALRHAGYGREQIHSLIHPSEPFLLVLVFLGLLALHTLAVLLVMVVGSVLGGVAALLVLAGVAVVAGFLSMKALIDLDVSEWYDAAVGAIAPVQGVFLMVFSFSALDVLYDFSVKLLTAGSFAPGFAQVINPPPSPLVAGVLYYILVNVWVVPHLIRGRDKLPMALYLLVPLQLALALFLGGMLGDFIVQSFR